MELDLRYRGEDDEDARYGRLSGRDLGIESRNLQGRYGVQGRYGLSIEYDQRPRFYGHDLRGPHWQPDKDRLVLPDGGRTEDLDDWSRTWDLSTERRRLSVGGQRHLDEDWKVSAAFSREEKEGNRPLGYGTWWQPSAVQLPASVNHRTDQFDLTADYANSELQAQFGYHLSQFSQLEGDHFEFDDPFSVPGFERWQDASAQKVSQPPDNSYHRLHASVAYQLQRATRFHAQVDLGRAQQDERYINDPGFADELADLSRSLGGQIDTTRISLRGTHRFTPRFQVRGGYRYEDHDNGTSVEEVGDYISRVHSWTKHAFDVDGDIRLPGRNNLLLGYEFSEIDREHADDKTYNYAVNARLRSQVTDDLSGSLYTRILARSGANYSGPGLSDNIQATRLYHLADLTRWEVGTVVSYSVAPELALGAEITLAEEDYSESELGLLASKINSYTLTFDYFPAEVFSGYAFVTLEDREREQGGEQRALDQEERTWTIGAGANSVLTEEQRLTLGLELAYMDSGTDIKVSPDSGGAGYPSLNVTMTQLKLSSDYEVSDALTVGFTYFVQRFSEDDWSRVAPGLDGGLIYLGGDERNYTAHMGIASVSYRF
ncbi:hypothetical protein CKO15_09155 [Halorhodospira abdelmalekii]|uniref:MtrB/PioB family decaheme-associated outer membrane protein n=1 Tax=Halorhodospira abdelmalekii TaxID=421629 RepID=UPI001907817E|nr:MtrB/PioB family decaheme-associated outer membrane protein [Halorhodospira abdelmalekii]MBK1735447.1 hypothetical protein [Halorhodospira abdelmalekii]